MGIPIEERIEGTGIFFPNFLKGYRDRINQYYADFYSEYPEYFPLMDPIQLYALHFKYDTIFLLCQNEQDSVTNIQANETDNENYVKLDTAPVHIQKQYFFNVAKVAIDHVYKVRELNKLGGLCALGFHAVNHKSLDGTAYHLGAEEADFDYQGLTLDKSIEEKFKPSSNYHSFEIEPLIQKVDSESFRYEFEESIKAYNSELYLAAAAVAGIALENLLKLLIVRRLGRAMLPKNQFIKDLNLVLANNKIIDNRLYHRIQSYTPIRNSSSHTNDGKAKKEDAEHAYNIIKELIDLCF